MFHVDQQLAEISLQSLDGAGAAQFTSLLEARSDYPIQNLMIGRATVAAATQKATTKIRMIRR